MGLLEKEAPCSLVVVLDHKGPSQISNLKELLPNIPRCPYRTLALKA